ncbi:MAG: hypothetical protein AAF125_13515 [Chloroflexota bacterium]
MTETPPITLRIDDHTIARPSVSLTAITPPELAWHDLANTYVADPRLTPYPAETLKARWAKGKASILVHNEAIIAYVGVKSVYDAALRERLGLAGLPDATVYQGVSGWTHPNWRRRGLGVAIRRPLYDRVLGPREIYLGTTTHVGATPVWDRLGFQVVPWDDLIFLAALDSWFDDKPNEAGLFTRYYTPGTGWSDCPLQARWNGGHVAPRTHPDHDWERYGHMGVSDPQIAQDLNRAFAEAVNGDLMAWQDHVAAAF